MQKIKCHRLIIRDQRETERENTAEVDFKLVWLGLSLSGIHEKAPAFCLSVIISTRSTSKKPENETDVSRGAQGGARSRGQLQNLKQIRRRSSIMLSTEWDHSLRSNLPLLINTPQYACLSGSDEANHQKLLRCTWHHWVAQAEFTVLFRISTWSTWCLQSLTISLTRG